MKTEIVIDNLKCGGCASTIKKTVGEFTGVQQVNVDIEHETISIEHIDTINLHSILDKLKSIGYPEKGTLHGIDKLATSAKSYVSCAIGKMAN